VELKCRLQKQLKQVREMSEGMLGAFQKPEQWTHQVHPRANHALWFAGHMGVSDNFFVSLVDPSKAAEKEGYQAMFGMGSTPTSDPTAYPPPAEVLAYMRDRRQTLLDALDAMSDEDLAKPTPEGSPPMWSDIGDVFEMIVWHESLHAGQLSVARRGLGHDPLFSPSASSDAAE